MVIDYATRTETIHKPSLSPTGVWPVAVDYGFSGVKGFSPNKVFCFPNCAIPIQEETMKSMFGTSVSDIFIRDKDGLWAVGERANGAMSADNAMNYEAEMYGRNRYFSPIFKTLVKVGLGIGIMSNSIRMYQGERIVVQTGLPPKYREMDEELIKEAIVGDYDFEMKLAHGEFQKFTFRVLPCDVYVMSQPMGSLISATTDNSGVQGPTDIRVLGGSNTIVFDPGFKTLDVYDIASGQLDGSNTFDNLGMHEIFRRTVKEAHRVYGANVTIPGMQAALKRGYFRAFDRKNKKNMNVPFDDLLEKNSAAVCDEAIQKLNSIYNDLFDHDVLIVTGGTGNAWWERINAAYQGYDALSILSGNRYDTSLSNIYSNVRGYYLWLVQRLLRRR